MLSNSRPARKVFKPADVDRLWRRANEKLQLDIVPDSAHNRGKAGSRTAATDCARYAGVEWTSGHLPALELPGGKQSRRSSRTAFRGDHRGRREPEFLPDAPVEPGRSCYRRGRPASVLDWGRGRADSRIADR